MLDHWPLTLQSSNVKHVKLSLPGSSQCRGTSTSPVTLYWRHIKLHTHKTRAVCLHYPKWQQVLNTFDKALSKTSQMATTLQHEQGSSMKNGMRNELHLFVCTLEEQPPESWFANATVSDIKKAPKDIGEWHNIQKYSTTIVSAKIDLRSKSHSTSLMKHRINLISILHVKLRMQNK